MKRRNPWLCSMTLVAFMLVLTMGACSDTDEAIIFEAEPYNDEGPAEGGEETIDEKVAEQDEAVMSIGVMTATIFSDQNVRDLIDPLPKGASGGREVSDCYESTRVGLTVTLDFTDCDEEGLQGHIVVQKTLGDPFTVTFEDGTVDPAHDFKIKDMDIDGTVALKFVLTALPEWVFDLFTSDGDGNPGEAVTTTRESVTGDTTTAIEFAGKMEVDRGLSQVMLWGSGLSEDVDTAETHLYYVGGDLETDLTADTPPENAFLYEYDPVECFCPIEGWLVSTVSGGYETIMFDIDDYERFDDGVDQEPIELPIQVYIDGLLYFKFSGPACDEPVMEFVGESEADVTVEVTADILEEAVNALCEAELLSEELCEELLTFIGWLRDYSPGEPSLDITIPFEELEQTILDEAAGKFDWAFCAV